MLSVYQVIVADLRRSLIEEFVWPAVYGNCCYEGRYLLGTALARPCIVQGMVSAATRHRAGIGNWYTSPGRYWHTM